MKDYQNIKTAEDLVTHVRDYLIHFYGNGGQTLSPLLFTQGIFQGEVRISPLPAFALHGSSKERDSFSRTVQQMIANAKKEIGYEILNTVTASEIWLSRGTLKPGETMQDVLNDKSRTPSKDPNRIDAVMLVSENKDRALMYVFELRRHPGRTELIEMPDESGKAAGGRMANFFNRKSG